MKVLMITDVYFPRVNGVSTSILTVRRELIRRGHEITLIAPAYGTEEDNAAEDIIRIPSRMVIVDPEDRMMKATGIMRLKSILRERNFDIVHIQTPFVAHYAGVKLSKWRNIPRVATYHTLFEEYLPLYVPFVPAFLVQSAARRLSRAQCNDLDAVIVPSKAMLRRLKEYGVTAESHVIPTGLNFGELKSCDGNRFRRLLEIPPQRPTLVYVGRVALEKNIGFLIEVVARVRQEIPEVLFVIAGEGPASARLRTLTRRRGLEGNIMFVGYLSRERELADCYCASDALIFASRTETQGLVLLEAMWLGVPVISTSVMGTAEILDGARGAIVAEDDVADFTAKVTTLLRDPALRAHLSKDAKEYARQWDAGLLTERLLDCYKQVICSAGTG